MTNFTKLMMQSYFKLRSMHMIRRTKRK